MVCGARARWSRRRYAVRASGWCCSRPMASETPVVASDIDRLPRGRGRPRDAVRSRATTCSPRAAIDGRAVRRETTASIAAAREPRAALVDDVV